MTSIKIVGNAKDIVTALSFLGASSDSNTAGFNPILLEVAKGKANVSMPNTARTGFVVGHFKCEHINDGQMVVDVLHTIRRIKKYFMDSKITLEYDSVKGRLRIYNDKNTRTSTHYPPAPGDCGAMPLPFPKSKNGMILFGQEGSRIKPSTQIKIDASKLHTLLDMAADVEVDYFLFHFKPKGKSRCWIGDETDKTQSPMDDVLDCTVKGQDAKVQFSADFPEIISSLKGSVVLYTTTNSPMWIKQKWDNGSSEYVIAPRIDE